MVVHFMDFVFVHVVQVDGRVLEPAKIVSHQVSMRAPSTFD